MSVQGVYFQNVRGPVHKSERRKHHISIRIAPSSLSDGQEFVLPKAALTNVAPVSANRRNRRPNTHPILRGNNIYGRKGKQRCLRCRQWRLKCEYDDIRSSCKVCSQKGLYCGAEQKLLARDSSSVVNQSRVIKVDLNDDVQIAEYVPRELPTPTDQTLSRIDGLCMEFYWCTSGTWFDLVNESMKDAAHPLAMCIAQRFGPYVSSRVVRSAMLFYSSFRKEHQLSYLGMQYLAQFYESAREAIDRESNVELLYACYIICLCEMACRRTLFKEFAKHASGFITSYQNVIDAGVLTTEEDKVMSQAHKLVIQITRITTSQWHQDENWFSFTETIIQRLESAATRAFCVAAISGASKNPLDWIPRSHYLFRAQDCVYQLCTLFKLLSMIPRPYGEDLHSNWTEVVASINGYLNDLARVLFARPAVFGPKQSQTLFLLKDGRTTLAGDKITQQLLTLYYTFLLQYQIMVQEWSDSTWFEAIQLSRVICRLCPSPHEAPYPVPALRFIVNCGILFSLVLLADSHNAKDNPNIRLTLANTYASVQPPSI